MRMEKFWLKFLDENYNEQEEKTICITAHGGTISMLNKAILKLPIDTQIIFPTGDTGVHEWLLNGKEKIMLRMNCQEHLLNDVYIKFDSKSIA